MKSFRITEIPSQEALAEMSSQEITRISERLTDEKSSYLLYYKSKQDILQRAITERQQTEQQARIDADPDYWKKHQGVGINRR
jgi:hypothetical protein